MKLKQIQEGKVNINIFHEEKISSKNKVFYNPVMAKHRSFSILFLKALNKLFRKPLKVYLPLAASGVRGIRLLKEANEIVEKVIFNDINKEAYKSVEQNLKLNEINNKFEIHNEDARILSNKIESWDYVDIDPFGSPNPFLDSIIQNSKNNSVIAVTATDTAPLAGTYEKACQRKYWAKPFRSVWMHEIGLRILIRKVQLVGSQYSKALIPLYSYAYDHIYRAYFLVKNSKREVDKLMKLHKICIYEKEKLIPKSCEIFEVEKNKIYFGPLWIGKLGDKKIIESIENLAFEGEEKKLFELTKEDNVSSNLFFYDINHVAKKMKIAKIPKIKDLINEIKARGFEVNRTHFSKVGIKTNMEEDEFKQLMRKII